MRWVRRVQESRQVSLPDYQSRLQLMCPVGEGELLVVFDYTKGRHSLPWLHNGVWQTKCVGGVATRYIDKLIDEINQQDALPCELYMLTLDRRMQQGHHWSTTARARRRQRDGKRCYFGETVCCVYTLLCFTSASSSIREQHATYMTANWIDVLIWIRIT